MCDTLVAVGEDRTFFAKNSDRPVGEAQVVEAFGRRIGGGRLRTQYLELDDEGAHALVGSRPVWLWGLEHGINEHGVAIGNEKIWTIDNPKRAPQALIGMDLVRLGLERGADADEALGVMTALLEKHGQGGAGEQPTAGRHEGDAYYSSFLIADRTGAWILETSGRDWATQLVAGAGTTGGAAISNRISIRDFDSFRHPTAPTGHADARLAVTRDCISVGAAALSPQAIARTLRDHGGNPFPPPAVDPGTGAGVTVCMHVRGYQVTAASMICELPADADAPLRAWAALGSPCVSVYVPVSPSPTHPSVVPLGRLATWTRFDALRQRVETDPSVLAEIRAALDPVQEVMWDDADPETAWARVEAALDVLA